MNGVYPITNAKNTHGMSAYGNQAELMGIFLTHHQPETHSLLFQHIKWDVAHK